MFAFDLQNSCFLGIWIGYQIFNHFDGDIAKYFVSVLSLTNCYFYVGVLAEISFFQIVEDEGRAGSVKFMPLGYF